MFTGIVQSQAEVYSVENNNNLSHIIIRVTPNLVEGLTLGASIAINGVCLTVVKFEKIKADGFISFDIIDETLAISNLAEIKVGSKVNVERSLKMGDELGGHIVSGHVHTKAILTQLLESETNCSMYFSIEKQWYKYISSKGFITLNGISLTVGELTKDTFSVYLIPETLSRTNLAALQVNDEVNVEFDQQTITIVNTIERLKLNL